MGNHRKEWYTRYCKRCNGAFRTRFRGSSVCADCDHSPMFKHVMSHCKTGSMELGKVMENEGQ